MYSRKSEGSIIEPWGTPALTEYSCEDFPFRTSRSRLLLRKEETRPNTWPVTEFVKKTGMQNSEAFNISIATARVAPDQLKTLAILSDTTVKRSAVDREDLKPYWKSEKRPHFSRW